MAVKYTRRFRPGDKGSDVEAVGRALTRAHIPRNTRFRLFVLLPSRVRRLWGQRKQHDLRRFKIKHGLRHDAEYTKKAHEALSRYFDSKARKLMEAHHPPIAEADVHWAKILASMKALNEHTSGYVYGAGHGERLSSMSPHDSYDCSSSVSKVLHDGGVFPSEYAWVSGSFASEYGHPGRGQYFTVYANGGHVWIRLHRTRWWRFDTSPNAGSDSALRTQIAHLASLDLGLCCKALAWTLRVTYA